MENSPRARAPPPYQRAVNDGRPAEAAALLMAKGENNEANMAVESDPDHPTADQIAQKRNSIRDQSADRGNWTGKFDFLMSMIAYAVGLGNVWRFPYLCYENGGGAFFIPYFLCWLLAATPIFFMEVSVGQFLGEGGISAYRICPIFKGVGWANQIIASMCNIYYCIIVAWAFFYVISSFSHTLPWENCGHWWNYENGSSKCYNASGAEDGSLLVKLAAMGIDLNDTETPVEQFWERRVLQTTKDIEETGYVQWELCLMMIAVWIFTYFALWKGITSSRKMIYVCATAPYVLLLILLLRGVTLTGAGEGIKFYLKPNMTKLATTKVWKDAGTQIFYSFGIGFGTLIALGSYNNYHHNVYRDAFIMCFVNSCTSLLAGFVVFSVLGYMAHAVHKTVGEVVKGGVGLAFLVYPEAIVTLPLPQLWSVLFFVMIMILGLDSQVVMVEGVITALADQFPILLRKKKIFVAVMCVVCGLLAMPMVTQSGQYWLRLMDNFGASGITLLFVVFFEIIALSWGFGADRIYDAIQDMIGRRPCRYWYYCWKYSAPIVTVCIFAFIVGMYEPLKYADNVTAFPPWAQALGLLMSITSMIMIPGYAIFYILTTRGKPLKEVGFKAWIMERLKKGVTPAPDIIAKMNRFGTRTSGVTSHSFLPIDADANADKKDGNENKNVPYDPKYSP